MDLGIAGRKAIVCASSRGLGRACAFALAEAGVDVVINGRNEETLAATAGELSKLHGVTVTPVAADVGSHEGQDALLAACSAPDILVNNNSGPPFKNYSELDRPEMIEGVIKNMITPIEMIQKVMGQMSAQKFGRIVNITSLSVKMPITGLDLSSGARGGLTAFIAGVAREVAPSGVTINGLLPGLFDTDRLRSGFPALAKLQNITEEEVAKTRMQAIPVKRFGDPAEFGNMCAFLCSAHAGYITGQNFLMDGGMFNSSI